MKGKDYLEQLKRAMAAKDVRLPEPAAERVSGPVVDTNQSLEEAMARMGAVATPSVGHRGLRLVWAHGREV